MPGKFVSRMTFGAGLAFTTVVPLTKCSAFYPTVRRCQCDLRTIQAKKTLWPTLFLLMNEKMGRKNFRPAGQNIIFLGGGCGSAFWRGLDIAFPSDADEFRNAGFLHGYAVKDAAGLHRFAVVRDDDELGLRAHVGNELREAAHVRFVEGRVDFVENTERTRLIFEDGDQQREGSHGFLTAGKQQHVLQALARRRGDDINARVAGADGFRETHFDLAAAENGVEGGSVC